MAPEEADALEPETQEDQESAKARSAEPREEAAEIPPEEEKRRDERKEDADAVSDLLKEAFGAEAIEAMPEAKKASAEKAAEEEDVFPEGTPEGSAVTSSTRRLWDDELADMLEKPSARKWARLRKVLDAAVAALNNAGIPPVMLLVYALVTGLLIAFGMSLPLVLGGLGVMVLFTALGLAPLDVLGIMGILILSMELADLFRQWGRIKAIFGL